MGYSRYVGRIGALAVALGVGTAVAAPTGVAFAAPEDSKTPSSPSMDAGGADTSADASSTVSTSSDTPTGTGQDATQVVDGGGVANETPASQGMQAPNGQSDQQSPSSSTVVIGPGVTVSSSGGAHTPAEKNDRAEALGKKTLKPWSGTRSLTSKKPVDPAASTAAQTNTVQAAEDNTVTTAKTTAPVTTAVVAVDVTPMMLAAAQPDVPKTAPSPVTFVLRNFVQSTLSTFFGAIPKLPTESPAAASFGVYRLDWTAKPAVGVIETVIDENEEFLAGGGGIEL